MATASSSFAQAPGIDDDRPTRTSSISAVPQHQDQSLRKRSVVEIVEKTVQQVPLHVLEIEEEQRVVDPEDSFPEGGLHAWLVVLGAFLTLFPSFGLQVSIGTLQDYWQQNQLSEYSSRDVGWIPSVFVYLGLSLGILVGPLFDRYGPKYIIPIGSILYVTMVFLLAECSKYWQFMLCCGVFGGICAALLTTTSLALVSHWFKEKRGFASGIAMCGNSVGGLTIPLILRTALPKYGYRWSIRILAFLFLSCLIMANLLLKARIPPGRNKKKSIFSFSIFKDPRVCFLTVSTFGIETVLFGALGILPTYASVATNFAPDTGFYLISILNGVSCLGRLIPGYFADRLGRFNVFSVALVFTLVIMLTIWLPFGVNSLAALYVFAAMFGFATGSWMALLPPCIGQLCRADEFGTYFGSVYFMAGSSLLIAIPLSGELVQASGAQALVGFLSGVLAICTLTFSASRWACLGWRWSWRAKI